MSQLIEALLKQGGLGILCAALFVGLGALAAVIVILWRRNTKLTDELYNLAIDKVRADEKVHGTLKAVLAQVNQLVQARILGQ